ncbi:MAG TPA: Pycsar system effector family protein, partial [Dyadobacter sp.]|nr:Pycsar system effector family protein [Dyadobacter sp.]
KNEYADPVIRQQEATYTPEPAEAKKLKSDRPDKGIETMFRISSNNHQRLSDMADNKAHIMITTTSIIISVLLSVLIRKLEDNAYLILPTMILLTICVITMVFSILATRPTIPHGTFTQEDIDTKNVNLLFFGNFYRMSYDDYSNGMQVMMNDREFLYGSLTKDVYSQGMVLGRKYRLLRVAYNVFMFGIVASVIAFAIASIFYGHTS